MNRIHTIVAGLGLAAVALPAAASAAPFPPLANRQGHIAQRIDQGIRSGALTRGEAFRLRGDLRQLRGLEYRYGRDGFSGWERQDLNRRYDALSARVRFDKHDRQHRW